MTAATTSRKSVATSPRMDHGTAWLSGRRVGFNDAGHWPAGCPTRPRLRPGARHGRLRHPRFARHQQVRPLSRARFGWSHGTVVVPAQGARGMGGISASHGQPERREDHARRSARHREVLRQSPGTRAGRGEAGTLRDRAARHRLSLHRRCQHRAHLSRLSFGGPCAAAATHAQRVGTARRHASRLLSQFRLPGVPSLRSGARQCTGRAASDGPGHHAPVAHVSAANARVDRMVGHHASGAARRHVAHDRLRSGTRRTVRPPHRHQGERH